MNRIDLEKYLSAGTEALVRDIIKAAFGNPAGSAFFAKYALSAKKAERRRHQLEEAGEHIPSFLIASITENCNLQCAGCYDRANHACRGRDEMSRDEWGRVFGEAEDIGISAILLAGGEPMTRMDILEEAAGHPAILFPVFTNGTMFSGEELRLFEKSRNLIPIISVEGGEELTDIRRGKGIYIKTIEAMRELQKKKILFGASVTVTAINITEVTGAGFISNLRDKGCRAAIFVEYVPVESPELALADTERGYLAGRVQALREESDMIIISFPGDEAEAGGCLAAGRGFFHINAGGGAEPCPFSPYSDTGLKTTPLRDALKSPLFTKLRDGEALLREHKGGCVLFDQTDLVKSLAAKV
ncbi:MAG: radical SAM protein [Clostridiales bacterium]|jgi:MoaA/NifB/PqqE/SkfB family radical SAM enzyme|nr:radical SAM protein [Clostridiales bacterium]